MSQAPDVTLRVRALLPEDAPSYVTLRREALLDAPLSFASSPDDDNASNALWVAEQIAKAPDAIFFGAFQGGLVGAVGLYRDRHLKSSHKAHLWGMYVTPAVRRSGAGARLLDAAVRHAEALAGISSVHLCVSSSAPGARRLYETAGFQAWGIEPDALRHEGETVSDLHMILRLPAVL